MQPPDSQRPARRPAESHATSHELLTLGRISGLFGVKGWVKVFSDTQPRSNITQYKVWWLKGPQGWQEYKVVKAQPHGKTIIASLHGISSREAAAALIDRAVAVPKSELPKPAEGEYYWADLVGCEVVTTDNASFGQVDRLFETGANDVLVVKADGREILIPWVVPDVIVNIDLEDRKLVVDWDPEY